MSAKLDGCEERNKKGDSSRRVDWPHNNPARTNKYATPHFLRCSRAEKPSKQNENSRAEEEDSVENYFVHFPPSPPFSANKFCCVHDDICAARMEKHQEREQERAGEKPVLSTIHPELGCNNNNLMSTTPKWKQYQKPESSTGEKARTWAEPDGEKLSKSDSRPRLFCKILHHLFALRSGPRVFYVLCKKSPATVWVFLGWVMTIAVETSRLWELVIVGDSNYAWVLLIAASCEIHHDEVFELFLLWHIKEKYLRLHDEA